MMDIKAQGNDETWVTKPLSKLEKFRSLVSDFQAQSGWEAQQRGQNTVDLETGGLPVEGSGLFRMPGLGWVEP